jgi:FKBP-type peptidyl-prolyl cis-trans isomerase
MRKIFYFLLITLVCNSCTKEESVFTPQTEADIIKYIETNNLIASKTNSGLYYIINNEGTGTRPTENSVVDFKYKGYFLDGTVTSESESALIDLSEVIEGLKEGLQLFKEGGDGTLIIPSELAYGDTGNSTGSIPSGAVLVFDIILTEADYAAENEAAILKYIDDNNLVAIKSDSGLYYVINNEGTGDRPTSDSNVTVAYKGYFLDGIVFDESSAAGIAFNLNQVIAGWTEGITYFKEGGDGVLLIPFNLGYGIYGNGSTIPAVTVLAFDVKLNSIN